MDAASPSIALGFPQNAIIVAVGAVIFNAADQAEIPEVHGDHALALAL